MSEVTNINEVKEIMDSKYALFSMLFAFQNRLQIAGDCFYEGITCKQFFLMACLSLFENNPPNIQELSHVMGSSHQNVKQLLVKLEQKGFVQILKDGTDKRTSRIYLTNLAIESNGVYKASEAAFIEHLFQGVTNHQAAEAFKVLSKMETNLIRLRGE